MFALLWLLGRLPLRALHALGDAIGWLWLRAGLREAQVAATNLALCFPELPVDQRRALLRQTLAQTGRTAGELCWLWTRAATTVNSHIRVVEGEQLFLDAIAAGRGVLIAAPHLGAWEALNLCLSRTAPVAILYRPPRQSWVEELINGCRGRFGAEPVRAEAAGVRTLMKRLKEGGVVGILPDQQPKVGEGEFAPFFGRPALTMSLFPKLAQRTGAKVLFAWAERLPRGGGFAVRFVDLGNIDDTAALNAAVESLARRAPAQYQWTYKRFGIQPGAGESPYRRG
jgi:KDO2-lipid IV(A) lauroyltransferase